MLAGIPQRPSAGNPINGPQRALHRRNLVLSLMLQQGSISVEDYRIASVAPITAKVYGRELDLKSPYPSEMARRQAINLIPDLYVGGYKIITTIDEKLQRASINALKKGLHAYDRKHGYRPLGNLQQHSRANVADLRLLQSEISDYKSLIESSSITAEEQYARIPSIPKIKFSEKSLEILISTLASFPTHDEIEAALTVFSDDNFAVMYRSNGELQVIEKSQSLWARRYIDVDSRGPVISSMDAILQNGDIAYIKREKSKWLLTQIPLIEGASVSLDARTGQILSLIHI